MQLSSDLQKFASACEHVLARAAINPRPLTAEEVQLIEYYCNELRKNVVSPSTKTERSGPTPPSLHP